MTSQDITHEIWDHVENQKTKTKIAKYTYNYLNGDNVSIILDGKVFWYEKVCSFSQDMPVHVRKYIDRYMEKQGYTYLYNI